MKECSKCNQVKVEELFEKSRIVKSGYTSRCLDCKRLINKLIYEKNREKICKRTTEYARTHAKHLLEARRLRRKLNYSHMAQKRAEYYQKNKEKVLSQRKVHFKKNEDSVRAAARARAKKYRKSPQYQLRMNLSNRIYKAIKEQNSSKDYKTMYLTGCPILQLIKHLESKFEPGMSWENYGQKGWHIDHVKPCASFNLVDPEEQKKCFHYSNLQPLWAQDNLSKGCKINWNKPSCNTHLESSSPLSLP